MAPVMEIIDDCSLYP